MATTFSDQRTCSELFGTTKQKKRSKSKPLHDFQLESYSKSKVSFNKFNDKIESENAKALSSKSWEKSSWPEMIASICFPKGSGLGVFWDLLCGVSRVPHGIFLSRPNAFVDLCSESSSYPRLQDQLTRWNFQQMQEILVTSAFEIKRFQRMLWMSSGMRRWRSWRFIKVSGVQTCNLAQRLSFPDSWWVMDLPGHPKHCEHHGRRILDLLDLLGWQSKVHSLVTVSSMLMFHFVS